MSKSLGEARSRGRKALGLGLIFATAGIWIVSSFLSGYLVSSVDGHAAAVHPFLLTYLATSLFTLYLPIIHLSKWASECLEAHRERLPLDALQGRARDGRDSPRQSAIPPTITSSTVMRAAAWAMPLWFTAQLTFNTSLAYTSVTSNTILSSTSSLFTFILSIFLLGEAFSSRKLMAIGACIVGTALVALSDNESSESGGKSSLLGDALSVLSTCLYAGYTVIMRKLMPGEEAEAYVALFFGYLGLFNTVLLAPLVVLMLSLDVFALSTIPKEAYLVIVLEGLLDYVLSDYLWARAVMLLGPTVATLGLSVQIPLAAGADLALGRAEWTRSAQTAVMTAGGTALIMFGFFGINLSGADKQREEARSAKRSRSDTEIEQEGLLTCTAGTDDRVADCVALPPVPGLSAVGFNIHK